MKTRNLAAVAVVLAVLPALVSFGCNKKEDLAPAPSATQAAAPQPPAPPPPTPTPTAVPQPVILAKPAVRADAGKVDAAVLVLAVPDAAVVALPQGLPPIPVLHPSQLPGIASGIVGGIVGALPSGLIAIPPVPSR